MVEDYGEGEIEYELAPVSAQVAYVQQVTKSGDFFLHESPTIILLTFVFIIFSASRTISRSYANLC